MVSSIPNGFFDIPKQQEAAVRQGSGDSATAPIQKVDVPSPAPNQILVKINWSGLCASNKSLIHDKWASFSVSMTEAANGIAGHEGAGVVVAVGDDMNYRWKSVTGLVSSGLHRFAALVSSVRTVRMNCTARSRLIQVSRLRVPSSSTAWQMESMPPEFQRVSRMRRLGRSCAVEVRHVLSPPIAQILNPYIW
jgi:hypothetical protein